MLWYEEDLGPTPRKKAKKERERRARKARREKKENEHCGSQCCFTAEFLQFPICSKRILSEYKKLYCYYVKDLIPEHARF